MYLAARGMRSCLKHNHDRIFFITFLGYLLVGTGSFAFHTTLKCGFLTQNYVGRFSCVTAILTCATDPMQLVDELSMIYTTCLMFWATFEHKRAFPVPQLLAVAMVGVALFITLYYHYLQDPTFHQNAYALLTAVVLLRSMYIMEMNLRPHYRRKHEARHNPDKGKTMTAAEEAEQKRVDERDTKILAQMWTLVATGLAIFLTGFGIWQLDNIYCSSVRRWRREIGLPWGILLEGHGWWHLMTGFGA